MLNIGTWMAALLTAGFALNFFARGSPDVLAVGIANALLAIVLAAVPMLHRFGALVGPLTVWIVTNTAIFIICSMVGTDTGMPIQYLALMAVMIVVVGVEHRVICGIVGVLAPVLIIATQLLVPADTGLQPRSQIIASLIAGTSATCAILFAIVFYALRDSARAKAVAEREYERSESLLHNILPYSIAERLKAANGSVIADKHEAASVLFADMAGFTERASEPHRGTRAIPQPRVHEVRSAGRKPRAGEDQDDRRRLHGRERRAGGPAGPRAGDGRTLRWQCAIS